MVFLELSLSILALFVHFIQNLSYSFFSSERRDYLVPSLYSDNKMGRKIEMKKIEEITKRQVTFSKRRSNLMKKAKEIDICCDVDVLFVAFSPSGRLSKFSSKKRYRIYDSD